MSEARAGGITGAPILGNRATLRGVDVYRAVAGKVAEKLSYLKG